MAQRALLCGINDFESVTDLRGCVNDVHNVRDLLTGKFGFAPENIVQLLDAEVTKRAVKDKWAWLLNGAQPGDHLVLHFSTHGSFIADVDGDEDDDGADELICLWNMRFGEPDTYLLDDEIRQMTAQVPDGVLLTVIPDTCHSASNTRVVLEMAAGNKRSLVAIDQVATRERAKAAPAREIAEEDRVRVRFLPPPFEFAPRPGAIERKLRRARSAEQKSNHLHLATFQDIETAADARIEGAFQGTFSYALCKALRDERFAQQPNFWGQRRPAPPRSSAAAAQTPGPARQAAMTAQATRGPVPIRARRAVGTGRTSAS